jgi:methionyl-tRNA synthetase
LFELADAIRTFTIILQPVLTNGAKLMKEQMNFSDEMMQFSDIDNVNSLIGLNVNTSTPIYERIKKI